MKNLKEVFRSNAKGLKFDSKLVKRIESYVKSFMVKTEDHVKFFGDNVLGVHTVKFENNVDGAKWFYEVLDVNDSQLKQDIDSLPDINPSFNISSDPFNLSCLWVIHELHNSKSLSSKEKENGMVATMKMLNFKFLTSIINHMFPYKADERIARAAHSALTLKSDIKRVDSWNVLFEERSEFLVSRKCPHWKVVDRFDKDYETVKFVNDVQTRVKSVVKNINQVFYKVHNDDAGINVTRIMAADEEGELRVRDVSNDFTKYLRYAESIIEEPHAYYKDELCDVVCSMVSLVNKDMVKDSILYMSNNHKYRRAKTAELNEDIAKFTLEFIIENKIRLKSLNELLPRLNGVFKSSRVVNRSVLGIKDDALKVVKNAVPGRGESAYLTARNALILYVALRVMSMHHYK